MSDSYNLAYSVKWMEVAELETMWNETIINHFKVRHLLSDIDKNHENISHGILHPGAWGSVVVKALRY